MCACSSLWAGGTAGSVPQDNTSADWGAFCALRLSCGAQAAGHLLPGCQERAVCWGSCLGAPGQYCWVPHSSPRPCLGITPSPAVARRGWWKPLWGQEFVPAATPAQEQRGTGQPTQGASVPGPPHPLCVHPTALSPPLPLFPSCPGSSRPRRGPPLFWGCSGGSPRGCAEIPVLAAPR